MKRTPEELRIARAALHVAILKMGSQTALAEALDLSYQAVQQWVYKGRVPSNRTGQVERLTGVSGIVLRPEAARVARERAAKVAARAKGRALAA